MCPLRRVEDASAGPDALGILVPPGRRTVVIVRPRALIWDLLLTHDEIPACGSPFRELNQEQAAATARMIFRALENWYGGGPGGMETVPCPTREGHWVLAKLDAFALLACPRIPGQPYRPMHFKTEAEAGEAAAALGMVLFPACDRDQEVYFNWRNFAR